MQTHSRRNINPNAGQRSTKTAPVDLSTNIHHFQTETGPQNAKSITDKNSLVSPKRRAAFLSVVGGPTRARGDGWPGDRGGGSQCSVTTTRYGDLRGGRFLRRSVANVRRMCGNRWCLVSDDAVADQGAVTADEDDTAADESGDTARHWPCPN